VPRHSRLKAWILFILVLLVLVTGGVSYLAWRQSVPVPRVTVTGTPPKQIGAKTPLSFVVEAERGAVALAEVRLVQGGSPIVVAKKEESGSPRVELAVTLDPASGVREGPATVEVWARDNFWRPLPPTPRPGASYEVTVDFTPPKLEVVATTPYLAPGGAGLVVIRAGDAVRAETRVGAAAFPTFALGPQGTRVGLFALPYDYGRGAALAVNAEDEAGNSASRNFGGEVLPRKFRRDTIELTDAFLQAKVPELLPKQPASQSLIDGFLVINRDQRRQAEEEKRRLAAKTADRPLWEGPFLQPKNTKVFSNFAETRTYRYKGRDVDTQVHFGYDLASTKQASVPAANKGVVVFVGPLTIYGNAIVLDHGLGLMTLYGHLSSIAVKVGDQVNRGQEIGRSGTTGLATGDHLHYEVLVHGVSVTPLEWWDAKWIQDRIVGPLQAAGLSPTGDGAPREKAAAANPAPARPARRAAR
jgi:murein DD-endopeptidase MepM/ murein hydrolase activator NlpD